MTGDELRLIMLVATQLERLVDAIAEGESVRALKDRMVKLEQRRDTLEAEIAAGREAPPLLHPNLAELYRERVARLHEALADEATRLEAAEIIRSLVDEIRVVPEAGRLRIDLKGDLAGILAAAANSKKPATGGDGLGSFAEQVKLVAGARYPLCRNRRGLPAARPV
jgi:hypothetical protein